MRAASIHATSATPRRAVEAERGPHAVQLPVVEPELRALAQETPRQAVQRAAEIGRPRRRAAASNDRSAPSSGTAGRTPSGTSRCSATAPMTLANVGWLTTASAPSRTASTERARRVGVGSEAGAHPVPAEAPRVAVRVAHEALVLRVGVHRRRREVERVDGVRERLAGEHVGEAGRREERDVVAPLDQPVGDGDVRSDVAQVGARRHHDPGHDRDGTAGWPYEDPVRERLWTSSRVAEGRSASGRAPSRSASRATSQPVMADAAAGRHSP